MFATLTNLWKNEDGATAIEYGLIAALIAVAAISASAELGTNSPRPLITSPRSFNDRRLRSVSHHARRRHGRYRAWFFLRLHYELK